jgi:hypothetical protein
MSAFYQKRKGEGFPGRWGGNLDLDRCFYYNVYGIILGYNDVGEVLSHKGDVVGQLVCYFSDECGGF